MHHEEAIEMDEVDDDDDNTHHHGPPCQTGIRRGRPLEVTGLPCDQAEEEGGVHGEHQHRREGVDLPNRLVALLEGLTARVGFVVRILPQTPVIDGIESFQNGHEFEEIANRSIPNKGGGVLVRAHEVGMGPL